MMFMPERLSYAKLKAFNDLVRFVGMSPTPFLFHVQLEEKHLYFIQITSFGGGRMIYYTELEELIQEKYV